MEKKILDKNDIKIVDASHKLVKKASVMRKIAYMSNKLDLDSAYIYQILYSDLFPSVSKVVFYKDEAIAYIAAIETYYKVKFFKKKLVFIKQWAVLDNYSFDDCLISDGQSVMEYLLKNFHISNKADSYVLTIAPNNNRSINTANRFAKYINYQISAVGYLECVDYLYRMYKNENNNLIDTTEKERCYVISKKPKKDFKNIKKAGLFLSVKY